MGPKDNTLYEGNYTQAYVKVVAASFTTSFHMPELLRWYFVYHLYKKIVQDKDEHTIALLAI